MSTRENILMLILVGIMILNVGLATYTIHVDGINEESFSHVKAVVGSILITVFTYIYLTRKL